MKYKHLEDRALVSIAGDDAEKFLENIVTCRIAGMEVGTMNFGALLTPQGKIMFDFFVLRRETGFLLDVPSHLEGDFIKRMTFYKLRAKVEISQITQLKVFAVWDGEHPDAVADPRHPGMGQRLYSEQSPDGEEGSYLSHRIKNFIPEGGSDFDYGDAYPHDVLMDQFGGVDFKKGCYVGQEVVSRMQHRGTSKKRVVGISADETLPDSGTTILADEKPVGTLGSVKGKQAIAIVRLDRIAKATETLAGKVPIAVQLPDWVNFNMPEKDGTKSDG